MSISMEDRKLSKPSFEGGIERQLLMGSRMEIMCHQTARALPPACRQELGTAHPEALTFLNGRAEPPRPPHYELPPQASWHKVLGQPRSSSATKPVMLQPKQSQPLQLL